LDENEFMGGGFAITMGDYFKPMQRTLPKPSERSPIVAYDFETTNIPTKETDELTIQPRYITMYGERVRVSQALWSYRDILRVIREVWPLLEHNTQVCAYNANRFDLRIIMQALIDTEFTVEPFASNVSGLRGAIVRRGRKRVYFLDPIAMLGMQCSLRTFLSVFAPAYPKGKLDFDTCSFDASNICHVQYAERDSEALYHALRKAQTVVRTITKHNLSPTVGGLAIRTFMSRMPQLVTVPALRPEPYRIVRRIVMRGGYVFSRKYRGPLWTYDLNQAYAYAMRECRLPSGRALPSTGFAKSGHPGFYRVLLSRLPLSRVPYIVRDVRERYVMHETYGEGCETWLTNDEVSCLRRHGWTCEIQEGYTFEGHFSMRTFVNGLEARRRRFPSGHPVNTVCKAIGCNAYGKTLQEPVTTRVVLSRKQPKNGFPLCEANEHARPIPGFWIVPETKDGRRCYERPQIGAWITAYVRCVVFDAIMQDPEHFVKADTDSVSFTRPVTLPISPWRYGAWKIESDGDFHIVVAKKVYFSEEKHAAKGMRTKGLTRDDYERWFLGDVPVQDQVQLESWRKGQPEPRWRIQRRRGTRVT
jgi:hypothetical protein